MGNACTRCRVRKMKCGLVTVSLDVVYDGLMGVLRELGLVTAAIEAGSTKIAESLEKVRRSIVAVSTFKDMEQVFRESAAALSTGVKEVRKATPGAPAVKERDELEDEEVENATVNNVEK